MLLRADQASVQADVAAARDDIAIAERGIEAPAAAAPSSTVAAPVDPLSAELLALAVRAPDLRAGAAEAAGLCDPRVAALLNDPARLDAAVDPERHLVDMAHMYAGEYFDGLPAARLAEQLALVVGRLRERDVRARRAELEPQIRQAELARDGDRVRTLLAEFQKHTEELNRLQNIHSTTNVA